VTDPRKSTFVSVRSDAILHDEVTAIYIHANPIAIKRKYSVSRSKEIAGL
jgi:hypothetical protein